MATMTLALSDVNVGLKVSLMAIMWAPLSLPSTPLGGTSVNKYRVKWAQLIVNEAGKTVAPVRLIFEKFNGYTVYQALEVWKEKLEAELNKQGYIVYKWGNKLYGKKDDKSFCRVEILDVTCLSNERKEIEDLIREERES